LTLYSGSNIHSLQVTPQPVEKIEEIKIKFDIKGGPFNNGGDFYKFLLKVNEKFCRDLDGKSG
jgi:hypothetical protein